MDLLKESVDEERYGESGPSRGPFDSPFSSGVCAIPMFQ